MGRFAEDIAEAVKKELLDSRVFSRNRHGLEGVTGRVFFVMPTSNTNYTQFVEDHPDYRSGDGVGTVAAVYNTIEAAVNACTANQGDVIYVMPGHTETISSATALNLDVAGVTIVGLGNGLRRPVLNFTTVATATVPVSAANVTLKNLIFQANFADIVSALTLAACKDLRIEDCLFRAAAVDMNFLHLVDTNTTDNAQDGLTMLNCQWFEPDAATLAVGLIDATVDRLHFEGNMFVTGHATVDVAALFTIATGKNLTNVRILRNYIDITGNASTVTGLLITTDATGGTGLIAYNFLKHLDATTEILITTTHTWGLFENRATAVANAQGYLLPAVDS